MTEIPRCPWPPDPAESIDGRWCPAEQADDGQCGGELRHVQRFRDDILTTYLRCSLCGQMRETMTQNITTGEVTTR